MSDTTVEVTNAAFQDTGNPVLDSVVNLLNSRQLEFSREAITNLHEIILEIAKQEPGGLKRRGIDGKLFES